MTGILDEYPGAAAAYSLRLLNTDYTGDAVIVRRASDNTTQSIGFIDGELDTTILDTFCTGTDGFVATWFDQSGNGNDAVQATASAQPKIYDAVSGIILGNGKPAISFDGINHFINTSSLSQKSRLDMYFVVDTNDNTYLYPNDNLNLVNYGFVAEQGSTDTGIYLNYGNPDLYVNDVLFTGSTRGDLYNFLNGYKLSVHQNAKTENWLNFSFGDYGGTFGFNGYLSELIAYDNDQSSNRNGIEDNINNHYSIY